MIDIRVFLLPNRPLNSFEWSDEAGHLRSQMRAAGMTTALVQGLHGSPASDPLGINSILRLATHIPGLHVVGSFDPTQTSSDQIRRVEESIKVGKVRALSARLDHGFDATSRQPYLELAAKHDLPVILPRGSTRLRFPMLADDVASKHLDVRFVISQIGHSFLLQAAEVVAGNDNVWADLSGLINGDESMFDGHFDAKTPVDRLDDLIVDARKAFRFAGKPDRFLFGSGWPMAPMTSYRTFVERIIPPEHHPAVFDANARSLFRLG